MAQSREFQQTIGPFPRPIDVGPRVYAGRKVGWVPFDMGPIVERIAPKSRPSAHIETPKLVSGEVIIGNDTVEDRKKVVRKSLIADEKARDRRHLSKRIKAEQPKKAKGAVRNVSYVGLGLNGGLVSKVVEVPATDTKRKRLGIDSLVGAPDSTEEVKPSTIGLKRLAYEDQVSEAPPAEDRTEEVPVVIELLAEAEDVYVAATRGEVPIVSAEIYAMQEGIDPDNTERREQIREALRTLSDQE